MDRRPESVWVLEKVVIGGTIRLQEGVTTVGRSPACTITVASDFASRTHAKFEVTPASGDIQITDLGSTNGIFVNDVLYNRVACILKAGDRIGIGVSVDDDEVTPDGKYPIFVLKRVPLVEENTIGEQPIVVPQEDDVLEVHIIPPSPEPSDCEQQVISDKEYDSDDNEDDFVDPQHIVEVENRIAVVVPSASAAQVVPVKNNISETIQSIFGDFNPEVLSTLSKDTRAIAEASTSKRNPVATLGDNVICISSDDECDDSRQNAVKSPQLFDDSFNTDDNVTNAEKTKEVAVVEGLPREPSTHTSVIVQTKEPAPKPISLKVVDVDENEEEELYFTQRLFDELREEQPDPDIEITSGYKVDEQGFLILAPIKQEKLSQSVDEIVNLDDDDDEYDEALESKVTDWSIKLFSQSISNSFNSSQVYEDDLDSAPATNTEGFFINVDDDDEDGEDLADGGGGHVIKTEKDVGEPPVEQSVSSLITPSPSEEEQTKSIEPELPDDTSESPLIRQRKRSSSKRIRISSYSSEEDKTEQDRAHEEQKERSFSSSVQNHEKVVNACKISTTDEIPRKKLRVAIKSTEYEKEERKRRQSASSLKTYSRQSSERSDILQEEPVVEDPFDKLKTSEIQNRRPSGNYKLTTEQRKSKDGLLSRVYSRSSSTVEEAVGKPYMSATFARRKSITNQSFVEENDADDFEEAKKSEPAHMTLTKMIRGPPEIINPPQLPINRGKLRGVSGAQKRSIDAIKAIQNQKDLKRKWIEKPSITKEKETAKSKSIKEDRKQRLKELADKKKLDAINAKKKVTTKETAEEKTASKKPKVKFTSVNRGAFLTEDTPVSNVKPYKIPKNHTKLNRSSSTSSDSTKPSNSKPAVTATKTIDERKSSTEVPTNFSLELLRVDAIVQNTHKSTVSRNRVKSTDVQIEQKERAPPRRNNNKLTFDAMEQHFVETNRLHEMQDMLAKASSMKSPIATKKKKKTVRFNDVPEIHYIEPILSATRKIDKKEPSTLNDRRHFIRRRFPIVDHTDELLNNVLLWSQLWLENKNAGCNMDGSDEMVFPMTNQFQSVSNYNSTIFPLLKIEFLAHLERHMRQHTSKSGYKVRIDYFTDYKSRAIMFAKCSTPIKQSELAVNDLALIDFVIGSTTSQFFGYIGNIRKTDSLNCITIEVSKNLIAKDNLKNATQITLRRAFESLRVYFGSFNAVHQLEKTPLFEKILNPLELLNVKTNWRPTIQYKGCDPLNSEQKEILLKTYGKAIDEYNPNISLIKGPPGTGKSRLITNLALQLLYGNEVRILDKKILICAQSNMAVDVIAQQLLAIQKKLSVRAPKYKVIRFGNDEKIHKDVKDITVTKLIQRDQRARLRERNGSSEYTAMGEALNNEILKLEARVAELQKENFKDVRQDELIEMQRDLALKRNIQNQTVNPKDEKGLFGSYLENANIVCATLSSCVKLSYYVNYFDVCIIDEATQCIEPWTIMPLKFGVTSLVLVGDTQQLPATVISQKAKDYGLSASLFTRIQHCFENNRNEEHSPIFSLHTQYRMHPEISKWPNMYFYKNQLLNAPNTAEFKSQIKPFSILNLEYTQNDHCNNGQIVNNLEAGFVAKLVKTLNLYIPNKYYSYGVITPYSYHREKLEASIKSSGLTNIMVNTIDSYQGIERDVIIISNARTEGVGFLANYQRLNVALTRPKKCLILCGNFKNLESVPSWASLLANAKERGLFHDISIADASNIDTNVIEKIKIKR